MLLLILSLCFVKALPEAFRFEDDQGRIALTWSARMGVEVSAGVWILYA